MRNLFKSLFYMVVVTSICSCSKKDTIDSASKGNLKLNLGVSVIVNEVNSNLKAGTDDFPVQIFTNSDILIVSYAHASEIPELIELPVGTYYATASSDNNQPVAFDNPYYYGKSGVFTIAAGQTSAVDIACSLANIKVTVVYSSQVTSSFTTYNTEVSNSEGSLAFGKDEARAGYFKSGPLHIQSVLSYTDGKGTLQSKTLTGDIATPQAGKHYEVHIDASTAKGNASVNIALNNTEGTEIINITENGSGSGTLAYGDLLITEIMYNPSKLDDEVGEWIEIYNNSVHAINLKGLVLRRGAGKKFHQVGPDVNLAAGTYVVLGRTDTATNNVSYVYGSDLLLTNKGDELIINTYGTNGTDGTIICSVNYGAVGFLTNLNGKSLQLDPSVKDATSAQNGNNWCASTITYSTGDYGTPGKANSGCKTF